MAGHPILLSIWILPYLILIPLSMDFSKLLTANYWFNPTSTIDAKSLKLWLIYLVALSVLGGLTFLNKFLYQKIRHKMAYFFTTTGLLGLLLLFFRFEGVYGLSARFWALILAVVAIVWFIFIIIYLVKQYPKELKALRDYKKFTSYLPKKKTK